VLGTYVLLESTMKYLAIEGSSLKTSTLADQSKHEKKIPTKWVIPQFNIKDNNEKTPAVDSMDFLAVESKKNKSSITNSDYVEWLGKPVSMRIANYQGTKPDGWINRPKGYWIPPSAIEVIERLKLHGIKMEIINEPRKVNVEMYRIKDFKFQNESGNVLPFEGHMQVQATTSVEIRSEIFPPGSAYVSTDQPLGDLAMILLEPDSPDSFFSWGFFMNIFQRTEYIEDYVMEPMMKKMLEDNSELKREFEQKKMQDTTFANNASTIYSWFYSKTKYYDGKYLLYPIAREK
jgi:hypothetical protein